MRGQCSASRCPLSSLSRESHPRSAAAQAAMRVQGSRVPWAWLVLSLCSFTDGETEGPTSAQVARYRATIEAVDPCVGGKEQAPAVHPQSLADEAGHLRPHQKAVGPWHTWGLLSTKVPQGLYC